MIAEASVWSQCTAMMFVARLKKVNKNKAWKWTSQKLQKDEKATEQGRTKLATVRTFAWEWAQTKVRRGSLDPTCTDAAAFYKCTNTNTMAIANKNANAKTKI